jgi:hypothetical protein
LADVVEALASAVSRPIDLDDAVLLAGIGEGAESPDGTTVVTEVVGVSALAPRTCDLIRTDPTGDSAVMTFAVVTIVEDIPTRR